MADKKHARQRRGRKTRLTFRASGAMRLCVHRTPQHIYAQIIDTNQGKTLASASTLDADIKKDLQHGGNIKAAVAVGKRVAEKARQAGVETVAFDRSGFRFHGRIKALAESARENGLKF